MTADDILPLIAGLTPQERLRLIRLLTEQPSADEATIYRIIPPRPDEFAGDEETLAWDAEGWESFG